MRVYIFIFLYFREFEELEAIKQAEEAALAEAEAAVAEATAGAVDGLFDFDSDEEDSIESSTVGSRITTVNGSITGNSSPKDDKSLNSSQSGLVKDAENPTLQTAGYVVRTC